MYEKITLPNGVRLLHEHIPHVRSCALGLWVGTGSRYENAGLSGASHFIEHMVFKGTHTRTAAELARMMDGIGGQINAFTTKECTCFHGRSLDLHLPEMRDVLCDMFFNARFDESDVTSERGVILEEIDMYRDSPEDLVSEYLSSAVYKGSALARPILGKKSTLQRMTGQSLKAYMQEQYSAERIVVALSGSYPASEIDALCQLFSAIPSGGKNTFTPAKYTPSFSARRKSFEQNHLKLAFPGLCITDPDRYAMQLLSDILGGGMSSRLFQSVREERGLCYSIYSYGAAYIDTGLLCVYTALGRETEQEALSLIVEELRKLKTDGVTQDELTRAREQVKANVLMGLESTNVRMNRLGRGELFYGRVPEPDEIIAAYDAVTPQRIYELAQRTFDFSQASFSAVGKTEPVEVYQNRLMELASQ
ncbi:MAG TPA: insulinase family protein [Papillibacter sp.]|nr:insulinase family protein [Papillibacter sp.]